MFCEDLFYRLNVVNLKIFLFREWLEDIFKLIDYFVYKYVDVNGVVYCLFLQDVEFNVKWYFWIGNVRELENMIYRVVFLFIGFEIDVELIWMLDGMCVGDFFIGFGVVGFIVVDFSG